MNYISLEAVSYNGPQGFPCSVRLGLRCKASEYILGAVLATHLLRNCLMTLVI